MNASGCSWPEAAIGAIRGRMTASDPKRTVAIWKSGVVVIYLRSKVFPLVMALVLTNAVADESDDGKRPEKKAQAVSKAVYDKIVRAQDAVDYLASIGISPDDIEPDNLPFSSVSFQDCTARVEDMSGTKDERAVIIVSCLKRHGFIKDKTE